MNSSLSLQAHGPSLTPEDCQLPDPAPVRLAVAVSGGADSMALLRLLIPWAASHGCELHALTVDHMLRPESTHEAAQVAAWCHELGVRHHILRWEHDALHSAIPEKARQARYRLLHEYCTAHQITHLCTAHHLDDQIETMLFRLMRGSGLMGLACMPPVRREATLWLHRPLLHLPKTRCIAYLETLGQPWIEDPTNQDLRFTRNAMRRTLVHLTDDERYRFDAVITSFLRFRQAMEQHISMARASCVCEGVLLYDAFIAQPHEIQRHLLRQLCQEISGRSDLIRSEKLERLRLQLQAGTTRYSVHDVRFHWVKPQGGWSVTAVKKIAA